MAFRWPLLNPSSLDGYVKLIDFGMCKTHLTDSKTSTFCGTLEYMAPEIYANFSYSFAVDYWALGILIFEMIYSMRPFQRHRLAHRFKLYKKYKFYEISKVFWKGFRGFGSKTKPNSVQMKKTFGAWCLRTL